ncbi:MAG: S8 family peptidase [Deltaproteobacteria bacterium]|nr:S8 family peptidase [Deltaproteobacteria bacterium]
MTPEKIAPELMLAFEDYQQEGRSGLALHARSLGVLPSENIVKPARTVVFIHCDDQARLDHLAQRGIRINQAIGRIRTAILPMDELSTLSDDPAVQRIFPSRYLRLLMDVAAGKVHVPQFRASSGLNGQGVIVGVVDSGIDPNHPAFAGRILRIWDQTLTGPGVPEGGYGAELTGNLLTLSRDTNGHGTHVAGIASGSDATFGGIAPNAELVIVKSDLQDTQISDAIRYIFRIANGLGRPAVINLSIGGHFDAHDGSDSLSLIIDSESGPGRIICCAAGNEGNDNIHAQSTVLPGTNRMMQFRVHSTQLRQALLNGWYPGSASLEVSIRTPGGFVTPWQAVIAAGNPSRRYNLPDARVTVVTPGPDPANGDHNFIVAMNGAGVGSVLPAGIWQLRVRHASGTQARVDVWTLDGQQSPQVLFSGTSVRDSMKVGSPGTDAAAITVASYTTKDQWRDIDGSLRSVGLALDTISDFSSEGPLRNGAQKPDVAAPGAMIVSALSADSPASRPSMVNSRFVVNAGTSMAAPLVTGIVALLLQRDRNLDPVGVKALLRAHSSIPGRAAGTFDAKWGFGLIDALGL